MLQVSSLDLVRDVFVIHLSNIYDTEMYQLGENCSRQQPVANKPCSVILSVVTLVDYHNVYMQMFDSALTCVNVSSEKLTSVSDKAW